MKRTNVVLDEELLERARRLSGEKTYQATITRALEMLAQQKGSREAFAEFLEVAAKGGVFHPDAIKEQRAHSTGRFDPPKRISAHEKRLTGRKRHARGSR